MRPILLCACGCGVAVPGRTRHGEYVRRYLPGHRGRAYNGPSHHKWRGGRTKTTRGYVLVYRPEHREADRDGYVFEHRLVYEESRGMLLEPSQVVDHLNRVRDDNRPENLRLFASQADHMSTHRQEETV